MIDGKRIAVVMPAYNAERTLEKTVRELPDVVDIKILVDDCSNDKTALISEKLGVRTFIHDANYGYGRNQQTCYREALAAGADIVVMVHADYPYAPALVSAMAGMVSGRMILKNTCPCPAPSTRAASMSSCGISAMKLCSRKIASGNAKIVCAIHTCA